MADTFVGTLLNHDQSFKERQDHVIQPVGGHVQTSSASGAHLCRWTTIIPDERMTIGLESISGKWKAEWPER